MNLQTLQREVGEWSRRNFPGNQPHHPLLGVAEELLYEVAVSGNVAEHIDCLCDALIFLCDYCERSGLHMPAEPIPSGCGDHAEAIGILCQAELKSAQGIRGNPEHWRNRKQVYVEDLVAFIYGDGRCICDDFDAALAKTWAQVSKRDWRKDPQGGVA